MKINKLMVLLLIVAACSAPQKKEEVADTVENNDEVDYYENVIPELKACIEAHGGLNKWKSFGTLEYDRIAGNGGDHQLIDLYNRKVLLKNDTAYTLGFDGENVWITPDKETISNPRFYHNLYFYFFAFPFVVADPGSVQEYLGQITFNGRAYKKVKITYGANVGDAPEDQYILWIDPETNLLEFINYSVTYFDASRAEQYNALDYAEWTEVEGLLMPSTLVSFRWENDSLGEQRGTTRFENITVKGPQPNQDLFEMPEGAIIDALPEESAE